MGRRTRLDWKVMQNRQQAAVDRAVEVLNEIKIAVAPIDPLAVADSEKPLLCAIGGDFRNRFDGQLEYHRPRNRFLLFYNTKKLSRNPSSDQ